MNCENHSWKISSCDIFFKSKHRFSDEIMMYVMVRTKYGQFELKKNMVSIDS